MSRIIVRSETFQTLVFYSSHEMHKILGGQRNISFSHRFLGGQTRLEMYDEIFQDDEEMLTCTVEIIPPKFTPLVQPCNVYFYRQVKNFIEKKQQNCSQLIEENWEINSREDSIKIQSIVHHQLASPIFPEIIKYALYASKLSEHRGIFMYVNEVCFPEEILKTPCSCKKAAFISCASCRHNWCFSCFYDNHHLGSCILLNSNDSNNNL